jgi:hypothetical protein
MAKTNIVTNAKEKFLIPDSLSYSSGIVTAVIYGQNYTVSLGTLTAAGTYFLYWNNLALAYSATVPSSYRSSNPGALLIGAFMADAASTPAWGSFMNIDGVPTAGLMPFQTALTTNAGANAVTLNATAVTNPAGFFQRLGDKVWFQCGFRNGSGGAATGTAGQLTLAAPTNLLRNTLLMAVDGTIGNNDGSVQVVSTNYSGLENANVSTTSGREYLNIQKNATGGYYALTDLVANASMRATVFYAVIGWTNTALKDL